MRDLREEGNKRGVHGGSIQRERQTVSFQDKGGVHRGARTRRDGWNPAERACTRILLVVSVLAGARRLLRRSSLHSSRSAVAWMARTLEMRTRRSIADAQL